MDGKPLIDRCVGKTVEGVLLVRGLEGLDRAAAWRIKQAARQLKFLGSGFPTGTVANGGEHLFPMEDYLASVPGDGTVLLVAEHETAERNGKRVYPRKRGALAEVQVRLKPEGGYARIARVYGSSAVDGDDFELYRLTVRFDGSP